MTASARESQTNQLLGYPADARLLIVNADDFGMCHSVNAAIKIALRGDVLQSTTLMVPCPWALNAIQFLKDNPDITFGIHLTALSDAYNYAWGPLSPKNKVPSLINEAGYFYNFQRMQEFFSRVNLTELEMEFRAQIETVLAANLKPTHLDWHSLRLQYKPAIAELMFGLAKEYSLALRVRTAPVIAMVQSARLPCNDYDFLDSYMQGPTNKTADFVQQLRELPEGLSEWAIHPAFENDELREIEPTSKRERQTDFDFLMSDAARDTIREEGIILLSYKPLQALWQRH